MDEKLLKENNRLLQELINSRKYHRRFIAGLVYGLGATVGVAVVLGIFAFIVSRIELIPIIGEWLSRVVNEALVNINYQSFQPIISK